jgi:hypothetical protein
MTINVGTPDRIVRLILGLLLLVTPLVTGWTLFANPVWTWVFMIAGLVLVVTGIVRFCPAYSIFNLSTSRTNDK